MMTSVRLTKLARTFVLTICAMSLLAAPMGAEAGHHKHGKGDMKKKKDIVDTAASNKSFSTLVTAIKAADLAEALKGKGPFTVFAPTNAAFEKLPDGTLESLLKPENKSKLQAILKYHVVSGRVPAAKVVKMDEAPTLEGSAVSIKVKDDKVMVDKAQVTKTDVKATNGIIHVIDTVLMPPMDE